MPSLRDAYREWVLEREQEAAALIMASLSKVLDRAARQVGVHSVVAAAAARAASVDDVGGLPEAWHAEARQAVLPYMGEVWEAGAQRAEAQVAEIVAAVPAPDREYMNYAARQYLAGAEHRLDVLGTDAWARARSELVAGFQEGEGVDRLRARVRGVTDLSRADAELLARTEVIAASNMGSQARVDAMGDDAPPYRQWLSTLDGRTRPTHVRADGQVVPRGEPFSVGGFQARVPGDPALPAAERANCRCTVLFTETAEPLDVEGRQTGGSDPEREPPRPVDTGEAADIAEAIEDVDVPAPAGNLGPGATNAPGGRSVGESLGGPDDAMVLGPDPDLVADVTRVIDSLHGDGDLYDLPVMHLEQSNRAQGMFTSYGGKPSHISLRPDTPGQSFTLAHEVGHWLDLDGMFVKGEFSTESRFEHPALQAVFKAMFDSEAGEQLFRKRRELARAISAGDAYEERFLRPQLDYLEYLLDDRELWARAYSQWVATRSGDGEMLYGLNLARNGVPPDVPYQWTDEDFRPIGEAIDQLMVQLGWRSVP